MTRIAPSTISLRPRRLLCGTMLLVGLGLVLSGCGGKMFPKSNPLSADARRDRAIAEKVKRDPFPTAAQAGMTTAVDPLATAQKP